MTLTEVSFYSRKYAPVVVIFILVVFIFYFAFQLFLAYLQTLQPDTVENTPTTAPIKYNTIFGTMPPLQVKDAVTLKNVKYVMDTVDGKPISASPSANIFLLPEKTLTFGFINKIIQMAKENGFDTDRTPYTLNGKIATFSDGLKELKIDTTNFNFTFNYTMTSENTKFDSRQRADDYSVQNAAIEYLRKLDRYPEDLARGKKNVIYMNYNHDSKTMIVTAGPAAANMAEIDFHSPDIDTMPVVGPKYFNTPHYVLLAFTDKGYKVIRSQVMFYEKSTEQIGVYPLKSGQMAFDELNQGKAFIISGKETTANQIRIKKMFLAYFDPEVYQPYLQPIFVFLGENNFVGYIPAVQNSSGK